MILFARNEKVKTIEQLRIYSLTHLGSFGVIIQSINGNGLAETNQNKCQ